MIAADLAQKCDSPSFVRSNAEFFQFALSAKPCRPTPTFPFAPAARL